MTALTSHLTLSVDRALLAAYRAATAVDPRLPSLSAVLDAALRATLAARGHVVPPPLLPAIAADGRRRPPLAARPCGHLGPCSCPACSLGPKK